MREAAGVTRASTDELRTGGAPARGERRPYGSSRDRAGSSLALDLLGGALAGAVGVWAMDRVSWRMYRNEDAEAFRREKEAQVEGKYVAHVAAGELADAAGLEPTPRQERRAGTAVHYLLGVLPGAAYGALRTRVPAVGAGRGLLYGLALFAVMDEAMAPALGLASGPRAYPWQAHARGLVAHLVLGLATHAALEARDRVA